MTTAQGAAKTPMIVASTAVFAFAAFESVGRDGWSIDRDKRYSSYITLGQ